MRLRDFMSKKGLKFCLIIFFFVIVICIVFLVRGGQAADKNELNTEKGEILNRDVSTEELLNDGDPDAVLSTSESLKQQERSQRHGKMDVADAVGGEAMELFKTYKILPSAVVAKAMFESGFGIADIVDINNYFYLKYEKGCGTDYQIYTYSNESDEKDVGDSNEYTVAYRKYATLKDGVEDYEKYLLKNVPDIANQNDYVKACEMIDPDNAEELITLIEQYQFDKRYDSVSQ